MAELKSYTQEDCKLLARRGLLTISGKICAGTLEAEQRGFQIGGLGTAKDPWLPIQTPNVAGNPNFQLDADWIVTM